MLRGPWRSARRCSLDRPAQLSQFSGWVWAPRVMIASSLRMPLHDGARNVSQGAPRSQQIQINSSATAPKTYLLLRRMHLAREALHAANPVATTVTDVATRYGFWQLGRFASQYKFLFGEAPPATLYGKAGKSGRGRPRFGQRAGSLSPRVTWNFAEQRSSFGAGACQIVSSDRDPLNFVERDFIADAIVGSGAICPLFHPQTFR
jgi:AraC-like DNA-binding protein